MCIVFSPAFGDTAIANFESCHVVGSKLHDNVDEEDTTNFLFSRNEQDTSPKLYIWDWLVTSFW